DLPDVVDGLSAAAGAGRAAHQSLPAGRGHHLHLGTDRARLSRSGGVCRGGHPARLHGLRPLSPGPPAPSAVPAPGQRRRSVAECWPGRARLHDVDGIVDSGMNVSLSIVTTLYRSAAFIDQFHERATRAAQALTSSYELVFVNDGSPDD